MYYKYIILYYIPINYKIIQQNVLLVVQQLINYYNIVPAILIYII